MNKAVDRPTVPDVLPLVRAVYDRHCAGCCLHILTDDGNCEQDDADYCLQRARETDHADCIAAAELIVQMTFTQRKRLAREVYAEPE